MMLSGFVDQKSPAIRSSRGTETSGLVAHPAHPIHALNAWALSDLAAATTPWTIMQVWNGPVLSAHLLRDAMGSMALSNPSAPTSWDDMVRSMVAASGVWGPHSLHTAEATGSRPVTP
jgi:hypothetical protein